MTVSGTGFNPGETVDFIMHSEPVLLGSVTSDAKGVATLAFTVPAKAEVGLHTIDMIGQTSGKALKTSLQVTQQSTTTTSTTVAATTTVAPTTTVSSSAAPTVAPTTVPSGSDELPVTGWRRESHRAARRDADPARPRRSSLSRLDGSCATLG